MDGPRDVYEWDEAKRASNFARHRIDFSAIYAFDWDTAVITIDDREDYGELRERAIGFMGGNLHVVVFTEREGRKRIVSLRRAGRIDARRYVKARG